MNVFVIEFSFCLLEMLSVTLLVQKFFALRVSLPVLLLSLLGFAAVEYSMEFWMADPTLASSSDVFEYDDHDSLSLHRENHEPGNFSFVVLHRRRNPLSDFVSGFNAGCQNPIEVLSRRTGCERWVVILINWRF